MYSGLIDLPWWGYVAYTLVVTHMTIAAVTIYLHRHQSHRALTLHPIASHAFRAWLWFTTGMVTKQWAAIHRKHHAKCETAEDPHSPQVYGIRKVLWQGAELYRRESKNPQTLERYGRGTPDDWIEQKLYSRYSALGVSIMLVLNFVLFGFIGITIWAAQMIWIPLMAAGVINGIGHYRGYRNFEPPDASRNIVPWGILIGGEELHNNHHAYITSARLSSRWYEFDIGWMYIRILQALGLAEVKNLAPALNLDAAKTDCDVATVQAVVTHRHEVLAQYARSVGPAVSAEIRQLRARAVEVDAAALRRWLHANGDAMRGTERDERSRVMQQSTVLATIYAMREELQSVWQRSTASKEQLVRQLEAWCRRAETSGIEALSAFSRRLRCYDIRRPEIQETQ